MSYDIDEVTYTPDDGRGVSIRGTQETMEIQERDDQEMYGENEGDDQEVYHSALASYIMQRYQKFKDARINSGVEAELIESHLAYIGEYSSEDLGRIPEYGSSIFMNLTSTKCRAGMSWIRDILLQTNGERFRLASTPMPSLPLETLRQIEAYFTEELENGSKSLEEPAVPEGGPEGAPQGAPQGQPGAKAISSATAKIKEINELKRNIKDSLYDEIKTQADYELKSIERIIEDDLVEGDWDEALSDFITDFCIYPTAFMKAPIITKEIRLTWVNGEPVPAERYIYLNKRVSPFDMYTDSSVDKIYRGDTCEHLRLSSTEVRGLIGVPGYREEELKEVLTAGGGNTSWFDSGIEYQKAELEKRGTEFDMNDDTIHGIHFHGNISGELLLDWGADDVEVDPDDPTRRYKVDAMLLNNEVVKCVVNDDPLGRIPYLAASFQSIPGSIWGRSIPNLMRDTQRMCNATARALADNMGLSSGPQVEIYIDRLADSGPIQAMQPRQIWQLKSDPSGSGGRAVNWFTVPSNAQELLSVYQDFEAKADDATGIPRYAYGNEKTAGAASTARGLAMLLESASKGIKDAIRNIDRGVIIRRVQHQFYYTMVTRRDLKYTGDIDVITYGSEAIILKAAQEAKRMEFLQTTANPIDQKIMGWAGRADILREAAKDLGFPHNLIPSRIELQKLEKEERDMEKQRLEIESKKTGQGVEATRLQIDGQKEMHQGTLGIAQAKIEQADRVAQQKSADKLMEFQIIKESALAKAAQDEAKVAYKEDQQNQRTNRQLAVDIHQSNVREQASIRRQSF